jgi:hypothetical protein
MPPSATSHGSAPKVSVIDIGERLAGLLVSRLRRPTRSSERSRLLGKSEGRASLAGRVTERAYRFSPLPLTKRLPMRGRSSLLCNESVQRGEDCQDCDSDRRHLDDLKPAHPERSIAHRRGSGAGDGNRNVHTHSSGCGCNVRAVPMNRASERPPSCKGKFRFNVPHANTSGIAGSRAGRVWSGQIDGLIETPRINNRSERSPS